MLFEVFDDVVGLRHSLNAFPADEHTATEDDVAENEDGENEDSDNGANGEGAEQADGEANASEEMLPSYDAFDQIMSEAGISNDDEIVPYDDTHGVFAARFIVTAEFLGHDPDKLHLLDGDFSAWQLEYETTGEPRL